VQRGAGPANNRDKTDLAMLKIGHPASFGPPEIGGITIYSYSIIYCYSIVLALLLKSAQVRVMGLPSSGLF